MSLRVAGLEGEGGLAGLPVSDMAGLDIKNKEPV